MTSSLLLGSFSWTQTYNNSNNTSVDNVSNNKVRSNTGNVDGGIGPFNDSLSEEAYLHGITASGGLSVGQPVFSLDYEYHLSNHFGVGAYGSYSARKGINRPGIGSLGADFKAHVSIHSVDIYVRPGLGIAYFDDSSAKTSTFAPIFAAGVLLRVTRHLAVGVEHLQIFNWTSNAVPGKTESLLAPVQFRF